MNEDKNEKSEDLVLKDIKEFMLKKGGNDLNELNKEEQEISPIPKEETRKSLYKSVSFLIIIPLFLFAIPYLSPDPSMFLFSSITLSTFFLMALVSFILYFIDDKIAYGMWLSPKKVRRLKQHKSYKRVRIGRFITIIIISIGLIFSLFIFIRLMMLIA